MKKKLCEHCGFETTETEKNFCPNCGAQLVNDTSVNQVSVQPAVQQNQQVVQLQSKKTNAMCIAGFIFSFIFAIIGLILSIIGMTQAKKKNENGRGFAIAGIIISIINIILGVIIGIILIFSTVAMPNVQANIMLQTACSNIDVYGDYNYYLYDDSDVWCYNFTCHAKYNGHTYSKECARSGYDY